jgi:hypothetical protein
LRDTQIHMEDLGFSEQEQIDLIGMVDAVPVEGNPDEVPAEQEREFSQRGEVFARKDEAAGLVGIGADHRLAFR